MTYICVGKLTNIDSDNGLSPERRQAIIWANVGILLIGHQAIIWANVGIFLIGPLGTNFREFLNRNSYIFIQESAFEIGVYEMAAILSRPQCVKLPNFSWCIFEDWE